MQNASAEREISEVQRRSAGVKLITIKKNEKKTGESKNISSPRPTDNSNYWHTRIWCTIFSLLASGTGLPSRKWSFGFGQFSNYAIAASFGPRRYQIPEEGGKTMKKTLSTHTQELNKLYRQLWAIIHWGIANLLAMSDCC